MSNQNKKLNLVLDDKKDNFNLISIEKSPKKDININYARKNNNINNKNNTIPKDKNKIFTNDLLNTKNEDELNLSNINIEKTQKFIHNADILFTEEEEKEDEKENENEYNNYYSSSKIKQRNLKKFPSKDLSRDSISISIDENKRVEFANNLFDKSLSSSIKSNTSNDANLSLVSDKRREVAEQLFQSMSDISSKKRSLNETIKSFNSNKSCKSNMSHVINNLSGSNMGLNINAIANKYANLDKVIHENEESKVIEPNENINNLQNSINDYNNTDEKNDDEIYFRKNLIDFNKLGNDLNISNNLNNFNSSKKKNIKENKLISSIKKIDLVSYSKEIKNDKKFIDNESKKNILKYNDNENNEINNSNSEISIGNIVDGLSLNRNKDEDPNNIIDISINLKNKNEIKNNKAYPIKKNLAETLKKKKFPKNDEKRKGMIEKEDSEGEASNEFLNKKIKMKENENENNESSILNNKNIPCIISIDDDNSKNITTKKRNNINNNVKKIQLINEKSQEKESINNIDGKETIDKLITKKSTNKLISDKNEIIKEGGGRNNLLNEKEQKQFIKIKKRKKDVIANEIEDEKEDLDERQKNSKKINSKNKNEIIFEDEKKLIYFNHSDLNNEKRFKDFLKEKIFYFNENIYNEKENKNLLKEIKENNYFENIIIKQETVYDLIINNKKKPKFEIPFYFDIMKETYHNNKDNFNFLFQFITIKDKEKINQLYKNIQNYNISNYHISPYINEINGFSKTFKIDNIKNIDYIRYTIDENQGDTFYGCFMFNLFEKYIINKDKENINIIILDIFKLYDLSPSIFSSNNINNVLIFFSIICDYIQLNLWDKVYDLFIYLYSQIEQTLIIYIKYNIFLYLSKIFSENKDKHLFDADSFYVNQFKKIIINYNEPSRVIFQIIPFIFGIKLEIIYHENKNENKIISNCLTFDLPKKYNKSNFDSIYIIYCNNCYHIAYNKNFFNNKDNILNSIKDNINKVSLIQYMKKDKINCDICEKEVDSIEIINDNNKRICKTCLYSEIDDYLTKRISFINEDYKSNYINYSYYLRPIELILKEPISIKNNIENNTIIIKNIDYFILFNKTFSHRISELYKDEIKLKNCQIKINKINSIKDRINNDDDNKNENCIMCQKSSDILNIECGCNLCEDCLYEILSNITDNQIILNGYEKSELYNNDASKCPICDKSLNLQNIIMLLEERGRDFENEYNEAKIRMKNYVKTLCFICKKEFENEKSLEVPHNSRRELFHLNVMINKHCFKDSKKNNDKNLDIEKQNEIDYSNITHVICFSCYKKNKNSKMKEIDNVEYKVFTCNICGIRHYISVKEWDKWNKHEVCCKCYIF